MASDIFWAKRASHIDDPETGLLARLPFSRDRLTAGVVAHLAVRDAICLGVLGRQVDARRLLTSIFGRVVELLEETEWIEELPAWDQYIRLQALSSSANIAHWLLHGRFDPALAERAYHVTWSWVKRESDSARPDPTALLDVMLCRVESAMKKPRAGCTKPGSRSSSGFLPIRCASRGMRGLSCTRTCGATRCRQNYSIVRASCSGKRPRSGTRESTRFRI